jgi:formylglycine-generating enzyme required for sulfatase activity
MGTDPSHFRDPKRPVEQVSWSDAVAFTERAGQGLRLPSEAEWEHACRAGTDTPYAGASSAAQLERMAWFGTGAEITQSVEHSHPVGGKAANALGLHDMHGNVYEWTADRYAADAYRRGASVDPRGPAQGDERSLRGGSWEARPDLARCANRNGYPAASRGYTVGFRVALSVDSTPPRGRQRRTSPEPAVASPPRTASKTRPQ